MKNLFVLGVFSVGCLSLVSCADTGTQSTANTSSVTMSSDPKDMTFNTVTQPAPPPADATTTTTTTDSSAIGYPAIHSNGQHY